MKVTWKVDDGYVGNAEHKFEIPDKWLEGLSPEEREMEIDEIIFNEFRETVSFDIVSIEEN